MGRTIIGLLRAVQSHRDLLYMKERRPEGWVGAAFQEVAHEARRVAGFLLSRGLAEGDCVALLAEGRNSWGKVELGILMAGSISFPISVKIHERGEILLRVKHSEKHQANIMGLADELPALAGILLLDEAPFPPRPGCPYVPVWHWPEVLGAGKAFAEANPQVLKRGRTQCKRMTRPLSPTLRAPPRSPKKDHSFAHTAGLFIFLKKASVIAAVEPGKTELGTIRDIPRNMKEVGPIYLLVVPVLVENFRRNIEMQIRQRKGVGVALFKAAIALGTRVNGIWHRKRRDPVSPAAWPVYLLLRSTISRKVHLSLGGRLVFMLSGGSVCSSVEHVRWFAALSIPVYQGYGLSETSPIISANTNKKGCFKIGSSERPFPWAEIRIEGEDGAALDQRETEEICVKGECVMRGHWRNEAATLEAMVDGWFHTGDLDYLDENDFLFIVGRIKSLLVGENGKKYSPETLEQHIVDNVPLLSQVMLNNQQKPLTAALIVPDARRVKELVAAKDGRGVTDALLDSVIENVRVALLRYRRDPALLSVFGDTWTPKTFAFLPEASSEENGTINSSLKTFRRPIVERYEERIREFCDPEEDPLNSSNREVLRSCLARESA
jgi:long-chain acyl-CoA synthetase